jgi:CO/xanthine dehydrogenase FAD-binding subunit
MDLNRVVSYRVATSRTDLVLAHGERILGGGTWLFSEPQPDVTGLVDVTGMGWAPIELSAAGDVRIAATATIAQLAAMPAEPGWRAHPLFFQCASALLASFKVWNAATVGGNICRSFAAGAMGSLSVALDATAEVWCNSGQDYCIPVAELVTGNGTNCMAPGDVLRAVESMSESPYNPVAAALGNAIRRAIGTRVNETPFSRDRIWRAIVHAGSRYERHPME